MTIVRVKRLCQKLLYLYKNIVMINIFFYSESRKKKGEKWNTRILINMEMLLW